MATKDRSKEIWLIPKRCNLHQSICLIDGIIARNYDGTSWNESKQNNLGVNLKNWGATNSGKNISSQAIRTLVASIPQYLGFLYINTTLPTSTINLTQAGKQLHEFHKDELVKLINLKESDELTIKESEIVLQQLEKLQITNPIILKDCENILLFPFLTTLKILLEVSYLDKEEIAYFLLKIRDDSEIPLIIEEIKNFRNLSISSRKTLIDKFKDTHIGNITLVQAPSASYYMSLCEISGLIQKINLKPNNLNTNVGAIKLKESKLEKVRKIVYEECCNIEPYNFENDLLLWIDYIGNPNHKSPPFDLKIKNDSTSKLIVSIESNNRLIKADEIGYNEVLYVPLFENDIYCLSVYDSNTGLLIDSKTQIASKETPLISINSNEQYEIEDEMSICNEIIDHIANTNFSVKLTKKLQLLKLVFGIDRLSDKALRGAYLEKLFYDLLLCMEKKGIITDLIWNGHIGRFGLPSSAPGGKYGEPDIIFKQNNISYVLELTTIKAKAMQHTAEGASVPDHIIRYSNNHSNEKVVGIYTAPVMHERVNTPIKTIVNNAGLEIVCLSIDELLQILMSDNFTEKLEQYYIN